MKTFIFTLVGLLTLSLGAPLAEAGNKNYKKHHHNHYSDYRYHRHYQSYPRYRSYYGTPRYYYPTTRYYHRDYDRYDYPSRRSGVTLHFGL